MAKAGGLTVDVARSLLTPVSATGDKDAEKALSLSIGVTSSYLEANVFEQLLQSPGKGVSAAHVLRFANAQGIPVYQITRANLGTAPVKPGFVGRSESGHPKRHRGGQGRLCTGH